MTVELYSKITGSPSPDRPGMDHVPVILLHGVFGSLENLGAVERVLSQDREVHSLDLRNHGRSPHADTMSYSEMAADVQAYMDRQGLHQVAVLGHSMGGKTAMRLALDAPDRVSRVIVADIAPVHYPSHHGDILEGLRALADANPSSRSEGDRILKSFVQEAGVRQFLLKNLTRNDIGGFSLRLNLDAIERGYDAIVAGQDSEHPYSGPVLFIKGGESDYLQEQHREKIDRLFPQATLRVMPGTGHWLHAEKPDLFSNLCQRFLAGELD